MFDPWKLRPSVLNAFNDDNLAVSELKLFYTTKKASCIIWNKPIISHYKKSQFMKQNNLFIF